jgi:CHAD domain-containing protein
VFATKREIEQTYTVTPRFWTIEPFAQSPNFDNIPIEPLDRSVAMSPGATQPNNNKSGLGYWMGQVLKELGEVRKEFAANPVHDLRVALRRCRSMGQVLLTVDPDPEWKKMRREGKRVFSSLGELRDCQVLMEWIRKLGEAGDPVTQRLLAYTVAQEGMLKAAAGAALGKFDGKTWERWEETLPKRVQRFRLNGEIFQGIALERWAHAHALHRAAMKSRGKAAVHRLRIGVKKFRYVVENFLPMLHEQIIDELKPVQDVLGEVHDLDVLWETAVRIHAFETADERERWLRRIQAERAQRVERYREWAIGKDTIWTRWRSQLPDEKRAERATFMRLRSWAARLDPDFAHTRRVHGFCARLYDGLARAGVVADDMGSRRWLLAAALLHDVGKKKRDEGHHRRTQRRIREIELPYGWSEQDRDFVALVARLHRGDWGQVPPSERNGIHGSTLKQAMRLGGILRLANALDHDHDGAVKAIEVDGDKAGVIVYAEGLRDSSDLAEMVAAARHLLESSCSVAILVRERSRPK